MSVPAIVLDDPEPRAPRARFVPETTPLIGSTPVLPDEEVVALVEAANRHTTHVRHRRPAPSADERDSSS